MLIFSIIAHPRRESFCQAISTQARVALEAEGHKLVHHDLYAEGFDPVLAAEEAYTVGDTLEAAMSRAADSTLRAHREEIAEAEGLLVVHPNWWGKPPAILSGWLDRVLVPGVAYRLETAEGLPQGLLSIRRALVLNTSDTPPEREDLDLGNPLELIWGRCVLPYCGVQAYERRVFAPIAGSDDRQRREWLLQVAAVSRAAFDESGA